MGLSAAEEHPLTVGTMASNAPTAALGVCANGPFTRSCCTIASMRLQGFLHGILTLSLCSLAAKGGLYQVKPVEAVSVMEKSDVN